MLVVMEQFPSCRWIRSRPGRALQMNIGARVASGEWLLFLHADTHLPVNWIDELRRANSREAVWGCFTFGLDSTDWRARVIERGVALRVRLFRLPYGDQALFIRRDVFERLGGYADLPLMEDVDIVRRLRRHGRSYVSSARAVTSARRWHREGWTARSVRNLALVLQYLAGVPPGRLAAKYYGGAISLAAGRPAVAVMARAPSDPNGKTRLVGELSVERATALRGALLLDTLAGIADAGDDFDIVVLYTPPNARGEFEALDRDLILLPQADSDLGGRIHQATRDLFVRGYDVAIIVGSDLPTLTGSMIHQAVDALRQRIADVVLGPAEDGGYYLLGLREPEEGLFHGIEWSTSTVLATTTAAANRLGLRVHLLPPMRDADTLEDLDALLSASGPRELANVRAWLAGQPIPSRRS